tara:strand:+ start:871 stop:1305 length:435 start_codon:yes stop_codon:yes gene_type:complete
MARITVEDCIDKFPSRFELVLVASNRARKLHSGMNPTIEKDNDKNTVIALREIATETLTKDQLKNDLIEEYQTATLTDDEDLIESEENSEANIDKKDNLLENAYENKDENLEKQDDNSEFVETDHIDENKLSEVTQETAESKES